MEVGVVGQVGARQTPFLLDWNADNRGEILSSLQGCAGPLDSHPITSDHRTRDIRTDMIRDRLSRDRSRAIYSSAHNG